MILMIDNYDSFTYNLVQYMKMLDDDVRVFYNDALTVDKIRKMKPRAVCLSPGPGRPEDAGITLDVIGCLKGTVPIFGVCLGFQAIVEAFGGKIVKARQPMHGRQDAIRHDGKTIYRDLPNPQKVARYHSLVADRNSLPGELEISAENAEGEIMSVRHRSFPIEGVQFHPESIWTENGKRMVKHFFEYYGVGTGTGEFVR
ncbi:aminodeoxychorismate/anthranilate synthase component II [Sporolactobacillus sp. THM7-7]|nr:aminodeoxychorismate/anthranilate synthase component II [Sporolactobacillus sp. THM7-7]